MRQSSPVPRATGAKVLIIVYLALAGQQASGDEGSDQADQVWKDSIEWDKKRIAELGPELKPKIDATNEAEKVLVRDFVKKKDIAASKTAYLKALKEEQDQLETVAKTASKEKVGKIYVAYVGYRSGNPNPTVTRDPEFRAFFNPRPGEPNSDYWTFSGIKERERDGHDRLKPLMEKFREKSGSEGTQSGAGRSKPAELNEAPPKKDEKPRPAYDANDPAYAFGPQENRPDYDNPLHNENSWSESYGPIYEEKQKAKKKAEEEARKSSGDSGKQGAGKPKKTKKRFGSEKRISNLRGRRKLKSEFKDMKKRRNSQEENLKKRSNLLKRQEKSAKKRARKAFDLEENMEDEDFMERFMEDRQDMDIVDRMERNIDKGSAEINHRKANPDDKGDSSSRSSGAGDRGVFWFSIVVGIIAEAVVIIVVLFAYRNDIFRKRQMRRSTREAEPLNPYQRYLSKISSATTFSQSMIR